MIIIGRARDLREEGIGKWMRERRIKEGRREGGREGENAVCSP